MLQSDVNICVTGLFIDLRFVYFKSCVLCHKKPIEIYRSLLSLYYKVESVEDTSTQISVSDIRGMSSNT